MRTIRRAGIACAMTCALLAAAGASCAQAAVSSNWAGYVALPGSTGSFSGVSGTFVQPSATCTPGHESYSAVWVGLGGYREGAAALEQVGVGADCSRAGAPRYATWYELVPAAPVRVPLTARPGDELTASVTARGHDVTLRIRDLATGARFSRTRRAARLDVSSADWIVEAPSECFGSRSCRTLPLADFGSAEFSHASAVSAGHTGSISDPLWRSGEIELRQSAFAFTPASRGASAGGQLAASRVVAATPSAPSRAGAFSVTWHALAPVGSEPQRPTLPGFTGGTT
jgi:Peptidase A4 family